LLKLRKNYPVLAKGKLRHVYAGGELYLLVKTYKEETALIILNTGKPELPIPALQLKRFLKDFSRLKNIMTLDEIDLNSEENLALPEFSSEIYLLEE